MALGHDGCLLLIGLFVDAPVIPGSWDFGWGMSWGWLRPVIADVKAVLIMLGAELFGGDGWLFFLFLFLLFLRGIISVGVVGGKSGAP